MKVQRYDPPAGSAMLEWGGEQLLLLPQRALWWPRESVLFIADPHFGKAAAFRFAGIAAPETSHDDDLARLDAILRICGAQRLVILGDFFHAKSGRSEATLGALAAWRARWPDLEIVLILGNHDRHAGAPPPDWRIECVQGPWSFPPFHCCHEPQEIAGEYVLAGHLHPSFRLGERIGSGVRGPCFHFGPRLAVLPAFGDFTGTHNVRAIAEERVFMIGPDSVIEIRESARKPRPRDR